MKIISLLAGLTIIGFIVAKQLDGSSPSAEAGGAAGSQASGTPRVPTAPADVKSFEKDMNDFIQDTSKRRAEELEDAAEE